MSKLHDRWTVMEHGPLEQVDDGLLTVAGTIEMPLGKFPRRMTVVRLADGTSAVFSAMALEEPEMQRIEALGRPAWLIVPSDHHRLDAPAWRARYPDIRVLTPPGARDGVAEAVPVDAVSDPFDDPEVRFETVPGTGGHEAALLVRRAGGTTLVVNDVIAHVAHPDGIVQQLMARTMGFGVNEPEVPRTTKRMLIDDPAALAARFRAWAAEPDLRRIIVSHGEVIDQDPAGELRRLADALSA